MNYETKQDVVKDIVDTLHIMDGAPDDYCKELLDHYENALPDDTPVIPEAVGEVIVKLKHKKFSLSGAMSYATAVSLSSWMTLEHEDDFALAWVLGTWKVEETGEIVKLEAEK